MLRVGVVGTGFIARGVARLVTATDGMCVSKVLTRRSLESIDGVDPAVLTRSIEDFVDHCDIAFEASGDAVHATTVLCDLMRAGTPVVTMDSELQVTTGSWFVDRGVITEADGDQPGCLARLAEEAQAMGFRPLAYVNLKGFLNPNPPRADMEFWSEKQGLRIEQVISFTDGTKLQIEQALVANGLGGDIARDGLIGATVKDLRETDFLGHRAREIGCAISDFVLCPGAPPGVMLVAEHRDAQALGDYGPTARIRTLGGEFFTLVRPYHLCHLEVVRTIRQIASGGPPLIQNGASPRIGVAAIAKHSLRANSILERGAGSMDVRGSAVRIAEHPDHVPICLLDSARLRRDVEPEQEITFDDVELVPSRALDIYLELRSGVLEAARLAKQVVQEAS